MNQEPINNTSVPIEVYQTLGKKTFIALLLRYCHAAMVFFFITIGISILGGTNILGNISGFNINQFVNLAAILSLVLFVLTFMLGFFIAYIKYKTYTFCLGENSLKIKRGTFTKEEIAIPYRQIQDVNVKQSLSYQMMGLSRLVILTAGHEDEKDPEGESEGILPAMDKNLAEWLQTELLKRTEVQKVIETK